MSRIAPTFILLLLFTRLIYSQEVKTDVKNDKIVRGTEKVANPQAITDEIKFKNETGNAIITITDEGSNVGSITLPPGSAPSTQTNKLYNVGGTLNFNGTAIGSGGVSAINDLADAKYNGSSLFLGEGAGANNFGETISTAVGKNALYSLNTETYGNSAFGYSALYSNTAGYGNTAIGCMSLYYNKGETNTAIGHYSLYSNTTGKNNTANGSLALYYNKGGNNGVAIGYESQIYAYNTTASYTNNNTSVGYQSLRGSETPANNTGAYNSAFGYQSLYSNNFGECNTAIGYQSLNLNSSGIRNTAIGFQSLLNNKDGSWNTANGFKALFYNTSGNYNTAIGYGALYSNISGNNGVAIGYESQFFTNSTATSHIIKNTSVGYQSLRGSEISANNTGDLNSAFGYQSLYANTTGSLNTANGNFSLMDNIGGGQNTANGYCALGSNTEGSHNVATGYASLYYNTTGSFNTAVGYAAGQMAINYSNTTSLGHESQATASNQVRLGNIDVTSIGGYANWSNLSDRRYKLNVNEDVLGIEFIMGLRPITYNLDVNKLAEKLHENKRVVKDGGKESNLLKEFTTSSRNNKDGKREIGFVAQEVEDLANRLGFEFNGVEKPQNENDMYRLRYAEFVVPLVKAVQEQQEMIKEQRDLIDELSKRLAQLEGR